MGAMDILLSFLEINHGMQNKAPNFFFFLLIIVKEPEGGGPMLSHTDYCDYCMGVAH